MGFSIYSLDVNSKNYVPSFRLVLSWGRIEPSGSDASRASAIAGLAIERTSFSMHSRSWVFIAVAA
jgi:hypothetical protein